MKHRTTCNIFCRLTVASQWHFLQQWPIVLNFTNNTYSLKKIYIQFIPRTMVTKLRKNLGIYQEILATSQIFLITRDQAKLSTASTNDLHIQKGKLGIIFKQHGLMCNITHLRINSPRYVFFPLQLIMVYTSIKWNAQIRCYIVQMRTKSELL